MCSLNRMCSLKSDDLKVDDVKVASAQKILLG
jgi:hypothetical protein